MLNLYPYSNGHLLIAPYRHVRRFESLTQKEWTELLWLGKDALGRLQKVFSPEGYNMGINFGRAGGAGIPGHIHLHVVPRWNGDTNFITIVSDTRVVSHSLREAHRLLTKAHRADAP